MWLDINFVIIQTKLNGITDKITYKSKVKGCNKIKWGQGPTAECWDRGLKL